MLSPGLVMKFGGSSLVSPSSIRRVIEIVKRESRKRVLVASAHGDTTDRLLQVLKHAARAETYLSWKAIKELREYHFSLAEDLLDGAAMATMDPFLRSIFRDLHVKMLRVCDGELELTQQDRAAVLSLGEQLSSRLLAAALGGRHLDARKLILTDNNFCHATPRYWETYARIRRALAADRTAEVTIMGGFIASTEDGRTTVLGRGGSDLTATIAGAALNAEEIQIWKDVDGMLTCDPRMKPDGLLVQSLSYQEAAMLAQAGAKILHRDTIAPAERLRIPIFLRNTFRPQNEGTRIGASVLAQGRGVKSITCRQGLMLLNISAQPSDFSHVDLIALAQEMREQNPGIQILSACPEHLLLVADSQTDFSAWKMVEAGCLQVRLKAAQLLMTLVGADAETSCGRVKQAMGADACVVAGDGCVYVVVADSDSRKSLDLLHAALFQSADPRLFSPRALPAPEVNGKQKAAAVRHGHKPAASAAPSFIVS